VITNYVQQRISQAPENPSSLLEGIRLQSHDQALVLWTNNLLHTLKLNY
jgi:hypothetical protein